MEDSPVSSFSLILIVWLRLYEHTFPLSVGRKLTNVVREYCIVQKYVMVGYRDVQHHIIGSLYAATSSYFTIVLAVK